MTNDHTTIRCDLCARTPETGRLCHPHYQQLAAHLHGIETETTNLDTTPTSSSRPGHHHPALASHRAPARLNALVHLDHRRGHGYSETPDDTHAAGDTLPTLNTLRYWADLIRLERNYADRTPRTLTAERRFLTRHLDHATAQPWIRQMYGELRTLHAQLQQANGTAPDKPVGRCYLPADTGTCDGPIWVDDAHGHAHCGRCRATWDGHQLATLKFEMDRARLEAERPRTDDGRPMYTAAELVARGHAPTEVAVRVAAHRAGHRATRGHYDPTLITREDAQCARTSLQSSATTKTAATNG